MREPLRAWEWIVSKTEALVWIIAAAVLLPRSLRAAREAAQAGYEANPFAGPGTLYIGEDGTWVYDRKRKEEPPK